MSRTDKYRLLLIGDFSYGENYATGGARVIDEHGREYTTQKLLPFIEACDKFVLNLETPLVPNANLQSPMQEKRAWLHWADPEATGKALVELGVNAVSLANNHTLDQGEQGLRNSLDNLESLGIRAFGAGKTKEEAEAPLVLPVPEKFGGGAINLTAALEFRRDYDSYGFYASDDLPGNAAISADSVPAPTRAIDTFNLAFPHWGKNYDWITPRQQRTAHRFAEAGYDLVVGAGAHTIQEISRVDNRWIVYSIGNGNFQSGGRWKQYEAKTGVLPFGFWAILEVSAPVDGNRRVGLNLYPVYSDNKKTDFQPGPVNKVAFDRIVRTLTARTMPPGSFPNDGVSFSKDDLGHFIRLEVADWPVGQAPAPAQFSMPEEINTFHVKIIGPKVQRVGFGKILRTSATELGVVGWVRNRDDYLESIVQGPSSAVHQLLDLMEKGSSRTTIERVETEATPTITASRFRIRADLNLGRLPQGRDKARTTPNGPVLQDGFPVSGKFPSIGQVLGEVSYDRYEYRGSLAVPFLGLEPSTRKGVRGRFFLAIDDSWHQRVNGRYASRKVGTIADQVRRAKRRGAMGFLLPYSANNTEVAKLLSGENVILTEDTHELTVALVEAIRRINRQCKQTVITGSAGKSTTQRMLAHALRAVYPNSVLAPGNNRNFYELSLVELTRAGTCKHAIIEMALSSGMIQKAVGTSLSPDVAVITEISEAHLDIAKNLENVALTKSQVFYDAPVGGVAVINIDAAHSDMLLAEAFRAGREVVTYGKTPTAAVRLDDYDPKTSMVTAQVGHQKYRYKLGVYGEHNAMNSLAVLAVLRAYQVEPLDRPLESLAGFTPVPERGTEQELSLSPSVTVTVLNESYNANPASMRATITAFASRPSPDDRRKVALLGDILELGEASAKSHASLAADLAVAGFDSVLLFGPEMLSLSNKLTDLGVEHIYRTTLEEITGELPFLLHSGDHVLAKASHGTGLADWLRLHCDPVS